MVHHTTVAPSESSVTRTLLLPCPFCGGPASDALPADSVMGRIYCGNDDCFGPRTTGAVKEDAIKQWNTRADAVVATLKRVHELFDAVEAAENYSFSIDYGKDLLVDINQMVHRGGTNALVQDCLRRTHREIRHLRAQVEEWKAKHEDRSKLNHRRAEIIENLKAILSDHKSAEWQVLSAARAALSAAKGET